MQCILEAVCRLRICRGVNQAGLEQDCWRLLNRCIQHVEAASERDKAADAAVQRVMDILIQQVTFASCVPLCHQYDLWDQRANFEVMAFSRVYLIAV